MPDTADRKGAPMLRKIRTFAYYASGYAACLAVTTGLAFGYGWITHTGLFA